MPITTQPAEYFGHQFITRKILTAFMDWLGDHLYVERYDENGDLYRFIQVPVQFAQREYFMNILRSNSQKTNNTDNTLDLNRILPRLSVGITSMRYDTERRLQKRKPYTAKEYDSSGTLAKVPTPAPYNLEIEVSLLSKTIDDNFQIIEQIVPYFSPSYTLNLNILPNFESESIPFILNDVTPDTNDQFAVDEARVFISTLSFTAKANYYYIKRDINVIKEIIANYHVGEVADTWKKFQKYEIAADNATPTTTVAERDNEPVTETKTEL